MAPFFRRGEGFEHLLPQIFFGFAETLNRGSLPVKETQCLKNPSKFSILAQIECTQSLQFWSILGHNLPLGNQKNCLKPNFMQKMHSQEYQTTQVLGSRKITGPHQRFIRNSHISYNRVIHLLSGCQVSSSGYLLFSTLPRRNDNVYFGSGPNWPILGGLGAITPVNNVRLS